MTNGLTLDFTVNADFAQVEVDNQVVNLDRFSIFFPEKRDFFLENQGIFQVGTMGAVEPRPRRTWRCSTVDHRPQPHALRQHDVDAQRLLRSGRAVAPADSTG